MIPIPELIALIPWFAVPLEEDEEGFEFVKEFLLVPVYGMCIHVPPPPPNQVVHVVVEKPVYFDTSKHL